MRRYLIDLVSPRWSRWAVMVMVAVLACGALGSWRGDFALAGAPKHREQVRFMWAMARQESNADYYARNATSGAFGKYQIMPFNWPVWAGQYLGDGRADQTPYNQEKVAYGKLRDLYRWLGSWKRVAYWWLTGQTDRNEKRWSSYASGYVTNIMRMRKRAPAGGAAMPPRTSSRPKRGDWRRSETTQKLRLGMAAATWPREGRVRDGQVLRVHAVKRSRNGAFWVQVVTADGRLGWLRQTGTVPTRRPARPSRWADINKRSMTRTGRSDRALVHPRPR